MTLTAYFSKNLRSIMHIEVQGLKLPSALLREARESAGVGFNLVNLDFNVNTLKHILVASGDFLSGDLDDQERLDSFVSLLTGDPDQLPDYEVGVWEQVEDLTNGELLSLIEAKMISLYPSFYSDAELYPEEAPKPISLRKLFAKEELSIDHGLNALVDKSGRYIAQAYCLGEDSNQITEAEAQAYLKAFEKTPQMFNLLDEADTAFATLAMGIQSDLSPQAQKAVNEVWKKIRTLQEDLKKY